VLSNFPRSQSPPCCNCEDASTGWAIWNPQFINGIWASMLRLWDFKFVIRRNTTTAVYHQIAYAIIDEFRRARLVAVANLPVHDQHDRRPQGAPSSNQGNYVGNFPFGARAAQAAAS
jgi:hypothetical protein